MIQGHLFAAVSCNEEDVEFQCDGTCYYYYYDLDNDGKLGRPHGQLCAVAGAENARQTEYENTELKTKT